MNVEKGISLEIMNYREIKSEPRASDLPCERFGQTRWPRYTAGYAGSWGNISTINYSVLLHLFSVRLGLVIFLDSFMGRTTMDSLYIAAL